MNTGIGDAINLAWKFQAVLKGGVSDALLDTYEPERIVFARRLVSTTDRVFTLATAEGKLADVIRTRVVPTVLPALAKFEMFREFLFRTVSQVTINYRHGTLSAGRAGDIHGGDRLPWIAIGEGDNYQPLKAMTWQVHVYGTASAQLRTWCDRHDLPLHEFAWRHDYASAGFAQHALYLVRPDTYVALASGYNQVEALQQYFDQRGIRIQRALGAHRHAA